MSVVATIFVPLTFITGFFGVNFGWMVDHVDTQIAFWLLGFVVPAATAALSWRLLVRRFVMGDEADAVRGLHSRYTSTVRWELNVIPGCARRSARWRRTT